MTKEPTVSTESVLGGAGPLRRIIGRIEGRSAGATLVCIAGLHGNEPAGIRALHRVFAALSETKGDLRGELIGIAGNLQALERRRRYIDEDLNRRWHIGRLRSMDDILDSLQECAEDRERHDLMVVLESISQAAADTFFLDLHTTSSKGIPFAAISDTLPNRQFSRAFPVPVILGIEEELDGTMSEFLTDRGHVALTLEAGQHDLQSTVDNAEAAIYLALAGARLLDEDDARADRSRRLLAENATSARRFLEVRYRHAISPVDGFEMEPGFNSFDIVRRGELLARDRHGEIRSRWNGRILMPLYQGLGDDGFFIIREFRPIWLKISALLRHLRADAVAHWLPGVSRHPTRAHTLIVDRRIARFYSLEVLHLLGYRRKRAFGKALLVSRRGYSE